MGRKSLFVIHLQTDGGSCWPRSDFLIHEWNEASRKCKGGEALQTSDLAVLGSQAGTEIHRGSHRHQTLEIMSRLRIRFSRFTAGAKQWHYPMHNCTCTDS